MTVFRRREPRGYGLVLNGENTVACSESGWLTVWWGPASPPVQSMTGTEAGSTDGCGEEHDQTEAITAPSLRIRVLGTPMFSEERQKALQY